MKASAGAQGPLLKLVFIAAAFCVVLACVLLVVLVEEWSRTTTAQAAPEPGSVAMPAASPLAPEAPQPPVEPSPPPTRVPAPEPALQASPEPAPSPVPEPAVESAPGVATIELVLQLSPEECCLQPTGLPAVVQWQDEWGAWHDVEGWKGKLDETGRLTWWVEAKDFGAGPFRWLVLSPCACQKLAVSRAFHLPAEPGETVRVEVAPGAVAGE